MTDALAEPALPAPSAHATELREAMVAFMRDRVLPSEATYHEQRHAAGADDHAVPPVIEELKREARERGLWNLFLPSESGLTQLEYAPLAELSGWSNELAPEAINCQAPDTGNMELLHLLGTDEQKEHVARAAARRRDPVGVRDDRAGRGELRRDQHRDPDRARRRRVRRQRAQVVDQRRDRPALLAADPDGQDRPRGRRRTASSRWSSCPATPPASTVQRVLPGLRPPGPARPRVVEFEDVRVPVANMLGEEGGGFAAAQARLGPGRIHH